MPAVTPATRRTTYEFAGTGALVQALGLLPLLFFPLGTIAGVALLLIGSSMSRRILCSACGNRVEKTSRICPHCRAPFQ